ncbi:hypothetical protein EK21DRAFT_70194, partial [Setomelanomma holmii]
TFSSLFSRGWVLQERLLSPRSVYFGEIMTWECPEMIANEVFPGGIPFARGHFPIWGTEKPFRLPRLLQNDNDDELTNKVELYHRWLWICTTFSKCKLSHEADALPAISGLAKACRDVLEDSYLDGIWRGPISAVRRSI